MSGRHYGAVMLMVERCTSKVNKANIGVLNATNFAILKGNEAS
jgi:uncharacterized protein YfkK (UPF0435 family)